MGKEELHLDRVQAHTSNKMAGKSLEDLRHIFHRLKTLRCPDRHWQSWGSQCAMGDFSADLECSLSLSVSRIQVWVSPAHRYQNITRVFAHIILSTKKAKSPVPKPAHPLLSLF